MKSLITVLAVASIFSFAFKPATTKYFTREAKVNFLSDAPLEKIEGKNNQAVSTLDISTGQLDFAVLMKAFEFEKALMQEHFNENYVESDKFPKASFKGTITNLTSVKWNTDGIYPVDVAGKMTMHGVTKDMTAKGTITIKEGKISSASTFDLVITEYGIVIPGVVKDKVSNTVKIDVTAAYNPFEG